MIFASLSLGQALGGHFVGPRLGRRLPSLDSERVYRIFTFLATFGTVSTLITIFRTLSLPQIALYFYLGQGNRIKNTLYENYSAGILSLRYLVLYSASLGVYRLARFRKLKLLHCFNILLLGTTVLISSRLLLIATLVTSFFLLTWNKSHIKVGILKLTTWLLILFAILSLLNFSRNRNFYAKRDQSFTEAGLSEIVTYLGSPFHVSLGAARRLDEITAGRNPELYREYIDIEPELSTNSAFLHLHATIGYFAWAYVAVVCFLMGFAFSWLKSFGNTCLLLPCGAILYGCAELWRLDLFHRGIFIVWCVCGVGIPALFMLFSRRRVPLQAVPRKPGLAEPQT